MQQESIQHALGRIEQKIDDARDDVLEIKRVALTVDARTTILEQLATATDARTSVLERRNWSGGLNGKTWATIIVSVIGFAGTVAMAVAAVVAAAQH